MKKLGDVFASDMWQRIMLWLRHRPEVMVLSFGDFLYIVASIGRCLSEANIDTTG